MTELRKDYFLDRWTIIAPGRSKRPKEFKEEKETGKQVCSFCPGNEKLTPPEIGRVGTKDHWHMRWFPNKFPAVEKKGNPKVKKGLLTSAAAYGSHEIIAETPTRKQLWDLPLKEFVLLLKIYSQRIAALKNKKSTKYVLVVKNHGREGGASLKHSHTQVASLNILPPSVKQELAAYAGRTCNYCKVLNIERKSPRKSFENSSVIAFAPYASRFNYELWILPKRHVRELSDLSESELHDFADILSKALKKLKKINAPYNYYLHYSPPGANLHFHIELTPRLARWAGIELSSGIIINSVSPEAAARFYRGH